MPQKIFFIINPASGNVKNKPRAEDINNFFAGKPYEVVIEFSKAKGHATELTNRALHQNADVVVAVGGDGTVNEIARAMNYSNKALGIIPCGSGNGLARHHKIPFKIEKALEVICNNHVISHDSIKINEHVSFNVSGIGFDAHVAHLFGADGKRGFASYVKLVVKEFSKYSEFEYKVNSSEHQWKGKAMLIAIANASQFGNNAQIAPYADTNDGKADITLVNKMSAWRLPLFAYKVFQGRVDHSKYARVLNTPSLTISCTEKMPLHVDGEPAGFSNQFEITTLKSTLKLLVP